MRVRIEAKFIGALFASLVAVKHQPYLPLFSVTGGAYAPPVAAPNPKRMKDLIVRWS